MPTPNLNDRIADNDPRSNAAPGWPRMGTVIEVAHGKVTVKWENGKTTKIAIAKIQDNVRPIRRTGYTLLGQSWSPS